MAQKGYKTEGRLKKLLSGKYDTALRRIWYLLLFIAGGVYVALNWHAVTGADRIGVPQIIAIVWLVLLLLPLFTEMELFGFKFKRTAEKLEKQIGEVRALVLNSATANAQATNQVVVNTLSHEERKEVEKNVEAATGASPGETLSEEDRLRGYLYSVKVALDDLLKRIIVQSDIPDVRECITYDEDGNAQFPADTKYKLLHALQKQGAIDADVYRAVREIYVIANRATHGEEFDSADIGFVETTAPHCLRILEDYLASIQ